MQKLYMYSGTWDKILGWHQANGIRIANSTYSGTVLRYFNKSFFPCWWFEQFLLSHQDSNLDEQNQNLSCCHYTMGQCNFVGIGRFERPWSYCNAFAYLLPPTSHEAMATVSSNPNMRREKDSNLHGLIHGQFITPDRSTLLCLSNYTTSP